MDGPDSPLHHATAADKAIYAAIAAEHFAAVLSPRTAVSLYTAEALEVHRLLDEAGVPRTTDSGRLSMAQRVAECLRMQRLARQASVQSR